MRSSPSSSTRGSSSAGRSAEVVAARIPAAVAPALRARLAGRVADWPSLGAEAWAEAAAALDAQGVLPLVHAGGFASARPGGDDALPPVLAAAAAAAYFRVAAHNALLLAERDDVLAALAGRGVRAVPLKGAALLGTAYPNVALRPLGDLDLLVDPDAMGAAGAALEARGYERLLTGIPALRHHLEYARVLPSGVRLVVELHRRPLAAPSLEDGLPARAVLAGAAPDPRAGGPAIPRPEHLLLHAAAHLVVQHAGEERLIWVADVDRIVRRWFVAGGDGHHADGGPTGDSGSHAPAELDSPARACWLSVVADAEAAGLFPALGAALEASALWFGTPVPPGAPAWRGASGAATLARQRDRAPVGREGARVLGDTRGLRSWRARLALALRSAFPAPAYMRAWYGVDRPARLPIYYAARLGRGLWHIALHAARPASVRRSAAEPPERWMIDG